jgi:PST family polysaccharide transporter
MAKEITQRVLKATTMLGSTQMLSMLCSVVRNKLLSLWVGALGVGLVGIYFSALELVGQLTQLNVRTSAVRDLASAPASRRGVLMLTIRRYAWWLGILGSVLFFLFAGAMSRFSFGDDSHVWGFRLISLTLLFQSLMGGCQVVLQSFDKYKHIAASSVWTALIGLLITVPLYRFLGLRGIAPSLLAYGLVGWLATAYYSRRISCRPETHVGVGESLRLGGGFIRVGLLMTIAGMVVSAVNYLFLAYLNHAASQVTVGYFQAGYTMLWRYAAIIFTALAVEYYPRLSHVAGHPRRVAVMISHECICIIGLFLPCACLAVACGPWLVRLLFSDEFLPTLPYFVWGMVGMLFRPLSVCLSYSFLSNARGVTYFVTEVVSGVIGLALNIFFFAEMQFVGLGIATILWMAIDLLIMLVAYRCNGMPGLSPHAYIFTLVSVTIVAIVAALMHFFDLWWAGVAISLLCALPMLRVLK